MSASLWLENLVAYSVQVALVVLAGALASALLRLKQPRVVLAYGQALLAACLLLPLVEPWQRVSLGPAGAVATATVRIETRLVGSAGSSFPLHQWVLLVLAAGVGLGLFRLAFGLFRLRHYRRTARRIVTLPNALREANALVNVSATFFLSDHLDVPVTFGWLNPAVILPARLEPMEESHQRAIACHELLHVARRDWLLNLLEELILAFFWFHPAVWWLVRDIRLSREQVVDREVVALTGARKPYLHALLEIAGGMRGMPLPAPLLLGESQLAQRVALLVKEVRMSKVRLVTSLIAALAALFVAGGLVIWAFPLKAPAGTPLALNSAPTGPAAEPAATPHPATKNDAGKIYKVGGDVTAPVPISKPEPAYTPQAKKDKVQGSVILMMTVDASGNVADARVKKSLRPDLDESALKTVRTWKFQPAIRKGEPVSVRVTVEISFRLF